MYVNGHVCQAKTINKHRKNTKAHKCIRERHEDSWDHHSQVQNGKHYFVVCDDLVRPIRDFTDNNYIGIIWTRQGTKKVTQDDRVFIEVEEPARGKTLLMMRKIAIPPRHYAEFELECDELEGCLKLSQNHFYSKKNQTCGWTAL